MSERHITVHRRIAASQGSVWDLYADFPNFAGHWNGLRSTTAVGDQTTGVGARRRVELKPVGSMVETVTSRIEHSRRVDQPVMPVAALVRRTR